jgi:hypothetical protein
MPQLSRKWFIAILAVLMIGSIIAVSMRAGIFTLIDSNKRPSTAPPSIMGSRDQPQSNTTERMTIPEIESTPPKTKASRNQPSANETSPPVDLVVSQVNFSTFEDPSYGISIRHPSDWNIEDEDTDSDGTIDIIGFLSPLEDRFDTYRERLWLSLDTLPDPKISLGDYSNEVIRHNSDRQQDFRLLDNDTDSTILAGYPAYRHISEWTLDDEKTIKQMEIGTKIANKVYYLDYYAEQDKYNSFLPIIQEMINSFDISFY